MHKAVEICFLKKMDCSITQNTVIEAYLYTYYVHLETLDIELAEAEKQGKQDWIEKRCKDLESWLRLCRST